MLVYGSWAVELDFFKASAGEKNVGSDVTEDEDPEPEPPEIGKQDGDDGTI